MGGPLRRDRGKIASLLTWTRAQWAALEADLLPLGYTVGDIPTRLSWRQLLAWLEHAGPETKVWHAFNHEGPVWTAAEHRLADIADVLRGLAWQHQVAHWGKKAPSKPPAPLPRPYVAQRPDAGSEQVGSQIKGTTIEVMAARLAEIRRRDAAGSRRHREAGKVT